MSSVRKKAEEFVELHGGSIVGDIPLREGPVSYKVLIDNRMFHIYFSRRWYYNPDGISIPMETLEVALEENATIVMYVNDECVWQYASEWVRLSRDLNNSRNNTIERLILKEDLLSGSFQVKPTGMDEFL